MLYFPQIRLIKFLVISFVELKRGFLINKNLIFVIIKKIISKILVGKHIFYTLNFS